MPTYEFYCDPDDGGCGNVIEITCLMSEKDDQKPKTCKKCKKRKPIRQLFGVGGINVPKTLGSHADKQSDRMSEDEKTHLNIEHNKYKEPKKQPSWVEVDGRLRHTGD